MKLLVALKKKVKISIQFKMMWMKIKNFQRNMKKFCKVLKKEIKTVNGGKKIKYRKDF